MAGVQELDELCHKLGFGGFGVPVLGVWIKYQCDKQLLQACFRDNLAVLMGSKKSRNNFRVV